MSWLYFLFILQIIWWIKVSFNGKHKNCLGDPKLWNGSVNIWKLDEIPVKPSWKQQDAPEMCSPYRVAPRCPSGCRKCDCWAEEAAERVRSAEPGCRRADSYSGAGRRRDRPDLGWPPPPPHQAGTPGSPLLLTSTHRPWGGEVKIN